MFKVGQEYFTEAGRKARVICVDADFRPALSDPVCNVVAIVEKTGGAGSALHYFNDAGLYAGVNNATYKPHNLVSDEPSTEETALIEDIFGLVENGATERSSREQVLKIIRQLRKK